MPSFPYGVTVTIVSRAVSGTDEYGNDTYSETTEDIPLCSVQPAGTSETTQFTDQLSSEIVVYFPYGTDVEYIDALRLPDGTEYEVQGKPNVWASPFSGNTAPVEVRATKVTGVSV
jgi:hypothetical protein